MTAETIQAFLQTLGIVLISVAFPRATLVVFVAILTGWQGGVILAILFYFLRVSLSKREGDQ